MGCTVVWQILLKGLERESTASIFRIPILKWRQQVLYVYIWIYGVTFQKAITLAHTWSAYKVRSTSTLNCVGLHYSCECKQENTGIRGTLSTELGITKQIFVSRAWSPLRHGFLLQGWNFRAWNSHIITNPVPASQRKHRVSITNIDWLLLFTPVTVAARSNALTVFDR
jgi:hypothetical protein